ncbi:glycine cleavage system protein GcvH [bacterium]|nr:glycine cleavage system protein GcvH [bacterium]
MATFYYTKTHEYIREDGGEYYLGISDHAQQELGDITYVELPAEGAEFAQGDVCCTVESVKAVAEVYTQLALKVVAVNERLEDEPELVNQDAQGAGWLLKIELADTGVLASLMDQAAYDAMEK